MKKDNAFVDIANFELANELAAQFDPKALQAKLDELTQRYCPVVKTLNLTYRWSVMQAEYATDLVFKCQQDVQAFYPYLLETLIHAVKPANIATFLGRKLHGNYQDEMGNRIVSRQAVGCFRLEMGRVVDGLFFSLGVDRLIVGRGVFPHPNCVTSNWYKIAPSCEKIFIFG